MNAGDRYVDVEGKRGAPADRTPEAEAAGTRPAGEERAASRRSGRPPGAGRDPAGPAGEAEEAWHVDAAALPAVSFGFGQYAVAEAGRAALEGHARWLAAHPDVRVRLVGSCDRRELAQPTAPLLAYRRARSVKNALVRLGIEPDRLVVNFEDTCELAWRLDAGPDGPSGRRVDFEPVGAGPAKSPEARGPAIVPGRVRTLVARRGYGFVRLADGRRLYFNRRALEGCSFDELKPGDPVECRIEFPPAGPPGGEVTRVRRLDPDNPAVGGGEGDAHAGAEV